MMTATDIDRAIKRTAMLAYHLAHLDAMDRDHDPDAAVALRRAIMDELDEIADVFSFDIVERT